MGHGLEGGTWQVPRTILESKNGVPIIVVPKTTKLKRSVTLTAVAVEAVKRHRNLQLKEKQGLDGLWQEYEAVFTSKVGTPSNRHDLVVRSFGPLLEDKRKHLQGASERSPTLSSTLCRYH